VKSTPDRVETYKKGKQGSAMVCAVIGSSIQHAPLTVMDREDADNELGLEGSFTANSYIDTLERGLIPMYEGQSFR
jgi:hypothetical protein